MIEKERKYIFKGDVDRLSCLPKQNIIQGYFILTDDFEARVRIYDDKEAYITTKTQTDIVDERIELGQSVSLIFAKSILEHCTKRISKTRYYYTDLITVDVFHEIDLQLVEIEGELPETLPIFCGEDVTDKSLYKNKNLAR